MSGENHVIPLYAVPNVFSFLYITDLIFGNIHLILLLNVALVTGLVDDRQYQEYTASIRKCFSGASTKFVLLHQIKHRRITLICDVVQILPENFRNLNFLSIEKLT